MTTPASAMPTPSLMKGRHRGRILTRADRYFAEHGIHRIERVTDNAFA